MGSENGGTPNKRGGIQIGQLKRLYDAMVDGGYKQTYEEFVKGFTGNTNYANRKLVYDTFKEGGADVGSTYAEFMQRLRTPPKKTQPFSESSIQATIEQTQDFGKRTDKKLSAVKRNPLGVAKTTLGFPSSSKPANKRVEEDGYDVTWNDDKPQISRRYADTDGYTYDSADAADWAQGDIDRREAAEIAIARLGTEEDVRARLARAYKDRERISDEIDEEQDSRPWWQRMRGGSSVRAGLMRDEIEKSARSDMQQVEARISELEDALNTIREVKAAAEDDKFTARAVSEAKQALGDGWLGRAAQWGAKQAGETRGFFKGAGRGIVDTLKKKSFYDAGESDARSASVTLSAVRHAGTDEYTSDERKLLDAAAYNAYVQGTYGSKIGRGYKAGGVTAESLPFMVEMILNPASGLGHGLQRKVVRNLVRKYGKAAVKKATKKYMAKKLGARAAGDLAAAATMTATTGQMRVAGDTMQRMTGEIQPDISPDGDIVFKGTEGAEGNGFAAYAKAFGAQTIENHSEMVGEYFAPLIGAAGKAAGRVLGKVKPLSKLSDKMRLSSVADFIRDVNSSNWKQNVDEILKRAKFNGTIGEYAEEVVGNIENALTVGDMTLDSAENTGVFNKDINIDTFLGVGLMSGFCSAFSVAGYRGRRREALRDLSRMDDAIYKGASPALATRWTDVREKLLRGTEEEATAALNSFMADESIPFGVRNTAAKYGIRAQVYRGTVAAERKEAAEREQQRESAKDMTTRATEWLSDMQDAGDAGYLTEGAEGMNDAKNRLDDARAKVAQAFGINAEDVDGFIGDAEKWVTSHIDSAEEAALNAAMEYGLAKKRFDGMVSRAKDGMEREVAARTAETDAVTNKDTGTIIGGTLRERNPDGTERGVHVIGGSVALNADGTIDKDKSSQSLIVVDRATGEKMMVSPDALASVDAPIDAAQEKARVADETRKAYAERTAGMIDGTADLSAGATYTLTDKDGNTRQVVVTADKDGNTENADGTVNVSADGGKTIERVSRDEIEQAADKSRKEATRQRDEEKKAAESQEAAAVHGQPRYKKGQTFVLADGTSGEIVDVDEDGGVVVNTEEPMADGRMSARIEKADFDAALQRVTDEDGNLYWERADESAADGNGVQAEGNTPAVSENGESVPEEAPAAPSVENAEAAAPAADTEETPQPEEDAMPMKQEKDGRMTPDFSAATPERTHRYVHDESGLDREEADAFVEAKRKEAEAKAKGKGLRKPKMGTDIEKYKAEKARYEAAKKEAEAELAYWEEVKRQQDKVVVAEREEQRKKLDERVEAAKEQLAEDKRIAAEKAAEQAEVGTHAVNPKIKEKWDKSRKAVGNAHAVTLEDGTVLRGHYVLTEAGAATASHDVENGFEQTEGFPVDENGGSVNDRDYKRDADAQRRVREMADAYDGRALQSPVVVSGDGIVLSGNNRTMSGDLAARQGTDGAYVAHLKEYGAMYGFTPEQVDGMEHPRVVFVPDEALPYDAATFARFNAQDKKAQSKPEHAVKLGKVVPDNVFARIVGDISRYDRLSDYYAGGAAANSALQLLLEAGVINEMELPALRTGNSLSAAGRELIENTLIGKVFQSSPDAVRQIISTPVLRQSVTLALGEIAHNRAFAASGYDLGAELGAAVDLVYRARTAHPGIYRDGVAVSPYGREQGLFDEEYGDSRVTDATVLLLADVLNSGKPSDLRKVFALYNNEAEAPASGQTDMFSGGLRSKEEILKGVNEYFRNATGKEQKDAVSNAVAERKRRAEEAVEAADADGSGGETQEPEADGGRPTDVGRTSERQGDLGKTEEIRLSDEIDENGRQFVLTSEGELAFGEIGEDAGLTAAPILLSEGMITNPATNDGYGLVHIEARHGDQIRKAGYKSVLDFIETVAKNYDVIKEGNLRDGHQTYRLQLTDNHNNTLMVELSGDGTYWNINTAGIFKTSYGKKNKEVYNRHTTAKQSVETAETSQDAEQGDTQTSSSMNVPTSSNGKSDHNSQKVQENSEKSSANEGEKTLSQKIAGYGTLSKDVTDLADLPTDMAYRETDINELMDLLETGYMRRLPEGKTVEGASRTFQSKSGRTFSFGKEHGNSHGGKGFAKGAPWSSLGGTLSGGTARKVLIGVPGSIMDWQEGHHGSYKKARPFDEIEHGKPLWVPFDEGGDITDIGAEDIRAWVADAEGNYHEFIPSTQNKPFAEYAGVKKETVANAPAKAESKQTESKGYTIAPATYTNKKGKTSDVHLLTFEKELTEEQERAVNEFAKERTGKGRFAPARGWKDRKSGGWMFRTEEDARKAAELAANPEAVADNQPLSAKDMREAVKTETHEDEDGGKKPAYERKEWTAESDISEMEKREKLLDNALHKNTAEEAELFPEAAAFRAKREALLKKVAAGEMSEQQAGEELRTEYADYIKRVNQAAEELSDLRFTLLAAKDNQQRKEAEEAKAQRKKELERKHNGFLKGKTALQASSADKALGKAVEFGEEGAMTIAEYIEKHHAAGDLVFEKKPYDQPHPRRWNAMSGAEQRRWEETHPRKVDYVVNGYFLGKTAYDYAEYLSKNGPAPKSEHSAEGNTSETKAEQPKKNPSGNKLVTDERYEELKKRMRAKLRGQLNMGVDPEILAIGTEMAVYHIEKGARKFAEFAKDMIADLGEAVRPYLKAFYNGARDLPEMAEYAEGLTPYDEVRAFDTANFDKPSKDVFAQAEMVAAESKAEAEAEKAEKAIKDKRNEQRKEQEKQKQTDTGFAQTGADATFADEAATKHNEEAKAEREANAAKGKGRTDDELIGEVLKGNGHNWAKFYKEAIDKGDTEEAYKWYRALGDIIRNTFGGDAERANKWAENVFFPYIGSDAFAGYKYSTKPEAVPAPEGIEPVGKGTFGDVYDQFKGKPQEAAAFLTSHKGGDLLGVFSRDGVGEIDVVWGDERGGFAHILGKHVGEGKSFPTASEAARAIDEIIKTGEVSFENGDKVVFKKDGKVVTIRKNVREGGKKIAAKNWVLTAYDEMSADGGVSAIAPANEVQAARHTDKPRGKVTPKSSDKKADGGKKEKEGQAAGDLFAGLTDTSETNKEQDNGLERHHAGVRSEGLPTDGSGQQQGLRGGERSRSQGTGQESGRADAGRRGLGTREDGPLQVGLSGLSERKNKRNNHSERGEDHAPKSVDARIDANIKAIELAQELLGSGETATPEQMGVLRRFSGWGGLGAAFNEASRDWKQRERNRRIRELLGEEAYGQAVLSSKSAYYTPASVVDALWDIAAKLGFKGGSVLEGSAGIGNILGQMPTEMSGRSDIRAIEIDSTSGGILSLLYPDAQVEIQGFEQTRIPNGSVDLAITNVPFVADLRVNDTTGDGDLSKKFRKIQDFCIAKNVRKLREGGIGIFITSNATLDSGKALREWVTGAGGTDFIGAFRLNNKTFGGTPVTSDIIVIRKRVNGQKSAQAIDASAVGVERTAEYREKGESKTKRLPMDYNGYFIEHPDHMAGEMRFGFEEGDTYRPTGKGLYPAKGKDQGEMLSAFASSFEEERVGDKNAESENPSLVSDASADGKKVGEMYLKDGKLVVAEVGGYYPLALNANKIKGHTKEECFKAYAAIKAALADVFKYQTENEDDAGLKPLLDKLNKAYDTFVSTYGHFNKNNQLAWLRNDVEYPNVFSLETYKELGDGKGGVTKTYGKADVMSKRVVEKKSEPHPTNVKDGVLVSMSQRGRIDIPYMAGLLGMEEEAVKREILDNGLGFEDPATREVEVAHLYLSGNVREKLRQAEACNENGEYSANIKALQDVVPMSIPAHLIDFSLGSSWLDPKLYSEYVKERTGIDVRFTAAGGTWLMEEPSRVETEMNRSMGVTSELLRTTKLGHELIGAAMQKKTVTMSKSSRRWDGTTETVTDREATAACAAKIDEIRQDFKDWMRQKMQVDAELSARMEREYNDRFNSYAPVKIPEEFAPEHFEGATPKFKMRPHQSKAIVRATMQPLLFAHEVGTGKTFTLISAAMEMRRLGTARKPMIVVQNATVAQFAGDAKELYPNAKILTLEDGDRNAEGRMRFYAKIKYNDWDMVIVPQSVFEKIPDSEKRQIAFIQDKIDEKLATLERMRAANTGKGKSVEVSRAENELEALRAEMAALSDGAVGKLSAKAAQREAVAKKNAAAKAQEMLERRTDEVEDFDDMGIDALLVDEAHEYKHLGFTTAMQRGVKGVDPSYSKKSQSVYLKAQAVLEKNHGRNVVFATGTPISNTAAEVWTFMRYLMSKETMEEYGIYYFDDFVSNFGNIQQMLEFSTSGKYKENNRFAGYVNLPELVRIWSGVADTVLTKDQKELSEKIPELEGGKAQDIYLPQTRSLRSVMKYVRAELARYEEMSGKEKKENSSIPLTMYGIAQAAAIDARLVMAEAEDDPNNKTNEAVRQTLRSLEETDSYKGTVAIFADHYQNKRSGFNLYEDIKAKLVAQGVPASEIVVIKSGMTIKKKQEIFDKVNHGEVRVILGSTSLLGTGVNIQERLHTLIHLDAPNRPMDYTQRNGRILRQGNLHKEWGKPVRVLRFGVEDSLDVTAYQRLKTKGAIADSIMEGERLMADSMNNRVLEEEEDVFGDTVAQLSGSEYAMLKNNAEKNVRKYESRRKQWQADQAYIHSAKPKMEGQIKATEQRAREAEAHLQAVQAAFPGGKFAEIAVGKQKFATVEDMADLVKEHNKKTLDAAKAMKENPTTAGQTSTLTLSLGGYDFSVKTELSRETARSGGALFSEVRRKMTYSCPALGLADVPVRQALLRNAVEDITQNVITGKDFAEQHEAAARQAEHGKSELEQLKKREGKPFEFEKELAEAKRQLEEYAEAMKAEMAEKEKKYAEMDASVEAATGVAADETADEEAEKFRDGEEEALAAEADEEMQRAKTERVNELSGRLNTPVRVISTEEEIAALPNERQRRAKGWFDTRTGEVTIVLPNNADAADVENTFLHEVVGHDGLRVLFPEEGQLDNALDELYRVSERGIRERIDAAARGMLEAEVARLMEQKRKQHEAKGENPNTYYYADLAEASLEASKKRDQYRRHAAEEYAADLAGRIGVEGFEKMSAEERTFWGRLKAVLQNALRRLSSGLGIKSKREWTDKEWAYVLHEAYKRKKNGGRPSAFDVADTVVMRGKMGFGEASKEETSIDDVNGRFNEQLGTLTEENADNVVLSLGRPSPVLRAAGVEDKPMKLYGNKVTKKMRKHGFSLDELRDLPRAVADPIAVFDNYGKDGNRSILTELRTAQGNFLVSINLGKDADVDFNIVRSVFGKGGNNIVDWINRGMATYINKEKALSFLSHQSAPIAATAANEELSSAAKVVKDFVNPKETGEKNADTDIMFRDGNAVEYKKAQARDTYERRVSKGLYQAQEALQDSMLSLKVAMDTIMKAEGKKTHIEDIAGYENAYLGENRLSSVNQAECKEYARTLFKPLLEEVAKLASTADERAELTDYMMAKHGLERNKVMARRNAKRQADEEFGEEISKVQRELEAHPDDDKLTIRAHELALAKAKREEEIFLADSRDYSGLTALTQTDSKAAAEAEAQRMVEEYEKAHDTDKLWRRTRDVTGATLEKCYDCGLISAAQYSDIRSMYKHYIPLRGFDEKTDAEVYAHIGDKRSGFATPIKTARGRKSKADDPFANMEAMMESAIMAGNRNSLVKQRFLNFVLGHPSDLVSVSDLWLVHDDAADEWKPAHPGEVADTERIEEDDTPEEVERKMREFEKRMKALAAEDPEHYTRQGDAPNVYYRLVDNEDLKQHQVVVKRNGKAVVLTINGNPRAAQALNGLTNPDNAVGGIAKFFEWGEAVNRQLSAFYTTRNPDFVVSNFVRDSVYANTMVWAKESPNYAARFNINWARMNPAKMKALLAKLRDGTLDEGNETERMFRQFMLNGGETGYTSVRDIEKRKKDIAKELKKLNGQMLVGKALELLGERFDEINRAVENCARFAAFMTSRQMGRSIDRSIWDAKEVSVNFNKKGSGARFHNANGQTWLGNQAALASGFGRSFYVFWNAAVQGTTNFGRNVGRHPVKGLAGAAAMFALGMLAAGIGGGDGDDDKDGYYNLPDYVRRSNIVFRVPGMDESWLSIPLPVEYRALYGMGELAMSVMSGKAHYSAGELAHEMASQVSQMLPLDVLEGGGGVSAFVPSSVKPIAEILGNKSWTGLPIYKENDWNKDDPQYKKVYKNANKALVAASKWMNEATGGDEYTSGWGDVVNPAVVEHLLNGYFGGVARSIGEVAAMGETLAGKREYDPKDFMFVNRLVKRGDERTEYRAVNNEYFRVKEASESLRKRLRHYEEDTAKGVFDYAEKIRELNYSPDFRVLWAFEAHEPEIDAINEQLKEPTLSAEYRKELETELNAAKRRLVDAVNEARGEKR